MTNVKMKRGLALVVLSVMGLITGGCLAASDDMPNESASRAGPIAEQIGTAKQAVTIWRSDYVGFATPSSEGNWGTWQQTIFCNPGSWAIGYKMRVEAYQGRRDDTGLNSVLLFCQTPAGTDPEWISGYDLGWGSEGGPVFCPGPTNNFITSYNIRIEDENHADNTGANDVMMGCLYGGALHATNGNEWGNWKDWALCAPGSAACGLQIRFQDYQGGGDDTAMNAMRLLCCSL